MGTSIIWEDPSKALQLSLTAWGLLTALDQRVSAKPKMIKAIFTYLHHNLN